MSFPVFFRVLYEDFIELDLQRDWEPISFKNEVNLVAFIVTVDALVKFNDINDKPKTFLKGYVYNYFTPMTKIYAKSVGDETGKLYAYGEKVIT